MRKNRKEKIEQKKINKQLEKEGSHETLLATLQVREDRTRKLQKEQERRKTVRKKTSAMLRDKRETETEEITISENTNITAEENIVSKKSGADHEDVVYRLGSNASTGSSIMMELLNREEDPEIVRLRNILPKDREEQLIYAKSMRPICQPDPRKYEHPGP